jgi:hypothetical protein
VTFSRAEPNTHYRALRLVSAEGQWELGLSPYTRGMRLRMGRAGQPPSVIDFCLGHETALFAPVLAAVADRLAAAAENVGRQEIDRLFPWAGTRPELSRHLKELLGTAAASPV